MAELVQGEILGGGADRVLSDRDKELIAVGREPVGGNGVGLSHPGFIPEDEFPTTLAEYRQICQRQMLNRQESKRLAKLEAYVEAHREQASLLFGAKMAVISGLLHEATADDGQFDTSRLDEKRLKVLMSAIDQVEKRGWGNVVSKTEHTGTVDVRHVVAQYREALTQPDDV